MVRVGLLQCDDLPAPHAELDGDYPALFDRLFAGHNIELVVHRADHGRLPTSPDECDGWLIGGSRRSAIDADEWIGALTRCTAELVTSGRPLVGICFGHQIVARALGAAVEQVGWTLGAVDYTARTPAATGATGGFTIVASHQDQVVELPAGTVLVASSAGCPIAGFAADHVLTLQGHPEFTARLGASLVRSRRALVGDTAADAALTSLERPLDATAVGAALAAVLRGDRSPVRH